MAWSLDGSTLVTGSGDGVVRLWDVAAGKERLRFQDQPGFRERSVWSVDLSPDGAKIAAAFEDDVVRVWDLTARGEPLRFRGSSVAWSTDGRLLATGARNGAVQVRDAASTKKAFSIPGGEENGENVSVLAWSDENLLASVSSNTMIRISNGRDGSLIRLLNGIRFNGHEGQIRAVAWSPSGKLAAASSDGTVRVWDVPTRDEHITFKVAENPLWTVAWSIDGERIATGSSDGWLRILDVRHGAGKVHRHSGHQGGVYAVAMSPKGKRFVTGSADGSAKVWSAGSRKEVLHLQGHASRILALGLSHDGRTLAVGSEGEPLRIWALEAPGDTLGRAPTLLSLEADKGLLSVAVSSDGRLVAAGLKDGTVEIWEEGRIRYREKEHKGSVFCLAFDPAGGRLVSGADGTFLVWEIASDELRVSIKTEGLSETASAFGWSPDGKVLAMGSRVGKVQLYDVDSQEATKLPRGLDKSPDGVQGLAFPAADEIWILLGDGTLHRWNWRSDSTDPLDRFPARMSSVALSLDGRVLASVPLDERIVRVAERRVESYEAAHFLVSGHRGTWAACSEGRCWRNDDGTLFLREDEEGELSPVPPTGATADPQLEVEVPVIPLDSKEGEAVPIAVKIRNVGDHPVFWLGLQRQAASADDPLIFYPPQIWTKLDPGEEAELVGQVSVHSNLEGLGSRAVLHMDLVDASGHSRTLEPITVVLHPSRRWWQMLFWVLVLGSILLLIRALWKRLAVLRSRRQNQREGLSPTGPLQSADWRSGTYDVFICYNNEDMAGVLEITKVLRQRDVLPWVAETELRPGLPWQSATEEQIRKLPAAAVFIGVSGIGPWQHREIDALLQEFVERKCPVIPVFLRDCPGDTSLPPFLKNMVGIDFRKNPPDPISKLVFGITGKRPSEDVSESTLSTDGDQNFHSRNR